MSKWNYEGNDGEGMFFATIRGVPKTAIDGLPCVQAMKDTLAENVVGRDHTDKTRDALSHRCWFPAVYNFGGELIQVASLYPFDGFFALTCKVLDGEHDSEAIAAAIEAVNERAYA